MEAIVETINNELNVEVLLSSVLMLRLLGGKLEIWRILVQYIIMDIRERDVLDTSCSWLKVVGG